MRWLRVVILALVFGAMATVLVAWSCSLWTRTTVTADFRNNEGTYDGILPPVPAEWFSTADGFIAHDRWWASQGTGLAFTLRVIEVSGSSPIRGPLQGNSSFALSAGWPLPALRCNVATYLTGNPGPSWINGGSAAPDWLRPIEREYGFPRTTYVPFKPMAVGLACDTVLYGTIAFLAFAGLGALRRQSRVRRCRCTTCNYSRRGLAPDAPCPECGTPPP